MAVSDPDQIMDVIKRACLAQGLTQAQVAKLSGVSLPTVKRWFTGQGVSLDVLSDLMKLTNLSFQDIASLLPEQGTESFFYTRDQEEFLAQHPSHLAFFDYLVNGLSVKKIQNRFALKQRSVRTFLRELEDVGLIEVHAGDRVKIVPKGSPAWRPDGPLDRTYGKKAVQEFIDKEWNSSLTLYLHRYSKVDRESIERKISELAILAKQANQRAKIAGSYDRSYGLLVGMAGYEFTILKEVKDLR